MNKISALLPLIVTLGALASAPAMAKLELTNRVYQEIETKDAGGKVQRKRVPAARMVPGGEVVYVISYRNGGDKPAENIVITNPVAVDLEYVAGSATGVRTTADVSVDGGKSYAPLTSLKVRGADGALRPAQAADVTHVRWLRKEKLDPGREGTVSFRARIR